MKYEIENWNNRTVFIFRECLKTFEEFSAIIDEIIKPDFKEKVQITSWTESFRFTKDGIEIYFENFYDSDPSYSFELFPLGSYNESSLTKLKQMMDNLNEVE